jgi:hypothetical protein
MLLPFRPKPVVKSVRRMRYARAPSSIFEKPGNGLIPSGSANLHALTELVNTELRPSLRDDKVRPHHLGSPQSKILVQILVGLVHC